MWPVEIELAGGFVAVAQGNVLAPRCHALLAADSRWNNLDLAARFQKGCCQCLDGLAAVLRNFGFLGGRFFLFWFSRRFCGRFYWWFGRHSLARLRSEGGL